MQICRWGVVKSKGVGFVDHIRDDCRNPNAGNYKVAQCRTYRIPASLALLVLDSVLLAWPPGGGTSTSINLTNSWGSTLAAVFVSLVFYGVSILQTYVTCSDLQPYYSSCSVPVGSFTMSGRSRCESCTFSDVLIGIDSCTKDSIILKSLVAWVFALDTLHTILISLGVWQYFVVHFGDDTFLAYTHAPLLISIVVTSAVSSTVQSFFISRIWFLTRGRFGWLFPAILMPFVVAQLGEPLTSRHAVYTVTAMVFQTTVTAVSGPLLSKVANALNGIAMAVDIVITISLCTLLVIGRTGFEECVSSLAPPPPPYRVVTQRYLSTDQMIHRLIFISINTGLSSALFAFLSLLLVRIRRNPFSKKHLVLIFVIFIPPGSSSYTRPISSSQPCISPCVRCIATRSLRASTRARSSVMAVAARHRN
ncbi:hypothetical protein J3R82DRAFT_8103 [Butyriboletus roseoflavus]|nr:hypothetical protein J3R82DRAFT_8103 [Butyriboletus roseoflavus]